MYPKYFKWYILCHQKFDSSQKKKKSTYFRSSLVFRSLGFTAIVSMDFLVVCQKRMSRFRKVTIQILKFCLKMNVFILCVFFFPSAIIVSYLITNVLFLTDLILNDILHEILTFVIQNYAQTKVCSSVQLNDFLLLLLCLSTVVR